GGGRPPPTKPLPRALRRRPIPPSRAPAAACGVDPGKKPAAGALRQFQISPIQVTGCPPLAGRDSRTLAMHDIRSIRDNPQAFDAALRRRGLEPMSARRRRTDETRRAAILASEQGQARRNAASKEIGEAKKSKDEARAAALMDEVAKLKTTLPQLEQAAKEADEELAIALAAIPN